MPLQARPERAEAERRILDALQKGEEPNLQGISKELKYSIQQVRRIAKKMRIAVAKPPSTEEKREGEITKVETVVPHIEEVTETTEKPEEPTLEGMINARDIGGLFQSVNSIIPRKYQKPREDMEMLGRLWEKPMNRIIDKYSAENMDILLATVATLIVFVPVPVEMMRDRAKTVTETIEQRQVREKKELEQRNQQ